MHKTDRMIDEQTPDASRVPPETRERSLRYGIRNGLYASVMVGGGENYLSAFALLLQATPFQIGLLSALPQLVGVWSQLLSVKALQWFRFKRPIALLGTIGQTAMWVPLLGLPLLFPEYGAWLLIAMAVGYFAMGHFAIPAWNTLLTDLIHPNRRGAYFSRRIRIMSVANFLALCAAGIVLHVSELWEEPWMGFTVIFVLAALARAISVRYLAGIVEVGPPVTRELDLGLWGFIRRERSSNFQRFVVYSGLMHACVLLSGPYFVVYMLEDLDWSYVEYAMWLASGVVGQFLTLKSWGHVGDRFGNKKILVVTGLIVPVLPVLYLVDTDLVYLVGVNFLGGVTWGGLALGLQNYVFDAVPAEDRAKGVAVWNTTNAIGWFVGAMVGGWLAGVAPDTLALGGLTLHLASNLQVLFLVSGLLRLVVVLCLLQTFQEARATEPISYAALFFELPLIKPLARLVRT